MGGKLKTLAIVLMVIGILVSVVCFFVGNAAYQKDKDCLKYATVNGGAYGYPILVESGDKAYAGLTLRTNAIYGLIGSIVGSLPLYWFGCLFERVDEIKYVVDENKRKLDKMNEEAK